MSRRSRIRKRERQKRRHGQKQKLALQLPSVRKVSTYELIQELERRAHILAEVFAESQQS